MNGGTISKIAVRSCARLRHKLTCQPEALLRRHVVPLIPAIFFRHRIPTGATLDAPGIEQVTQFADVARSMAVFQVKMGQHALGTASCGTVEQFVEVLASQEKYVLDERRLLLFGFES